MRDLYRILTAALCAVALMGFTAACDSGSGDEENPGDNICEPACEDGFKCENGTCVADGDGPIVCDPACEDGFTCENGECVEAPSGECDPACEDGFTCTDGECVEDNPPVVCDPACDAAMCMECVDGTCVSSCEGDEVCTDGACAVPEPCDGACDECQVCNTDTNECEAKCDADACLTCNAGMCESTCTDGAICAGEGVCEAPACGTGTGTFCDNASVISELVIAPATGDDACCTDFDGDGAVDNGVANLIANMGSMLEMDLETINAEIAGAMAEGSILVVLEHLGLEDLANQDVFSMNLLVAADHDDDPTNNYTGAGEFDVVPESLDEDGQPIIRFDGSSITEGVLEAGPSQFLIGPFSFEVQGMPFTVQLTVAGATIKADVVADSAVSLENGELSGYILKEEIFALLNTVIADNCACLNLDGELIQENTPGAYTCGSSTDTPTCDPEGEGLEQYCGQVMQYCGAAVVALPMLLDYDIDGDDSGDAVTVGARFAASDATIVGMGESIMPTEQ